MPTVEQWLTSLGLGKYTEIFAVNDVDLRALPHLDSADLQELGVSLGHRKIMLKAISEWADSEPQEAKVEQASPASDVAQQEPDKAEAKGEARLDLRLLSVLFCDMVGSTNLSERFNAEEMHDLLSAYQETVASEVTRFGGYVAKFLGDGVLAYFGWPIAYEDHAERAIRAGLAAIAGVEQLKTPTGATLESRVGIATGRVVVGDAADGGVLDRGQVAGDTPNLAARLQSVARAGQIVIADSTRRLAGHAFEFDDLGTGELKGFQGKVPAFRVRSERMVESRFDAAHGDAISKFVGRASEIGMLLDRWVLAKGGQGQAVFVTGEAGIGKSRLAEALVERIRDEPHEFIRLQCSPYHTTSAFYPIIQRLSLLVDLAPDDDSAARAEKLERLLAQYGEDPDEYGPVYAELLSLDLGNHIKLPDVSAQQRKDRTLRTLANRPFLAASRGPVLLMVEDAHWIDPSTSELLGEVVSRIHAAPIYVLVTHRPEWSADWARGLAHATTLSVGRLNKQQVRELIESMLEPVSDQLVDRIAERTDGVALFVEELTRSIRESGNDGLENVDIPESLQGSLMARLDRLPPPTKEVAQIASVIGREFDRSLLLKIVPLDSSATDDALRQLLAGQLVVMGGKFRESFLFRHALIRDTAYHSLLSRKRRQYHQAIADTIVGSYPSLLNTQPELVARHYTEAKCNELALPFWKQAGDRALERSANYEAVDHFSNALALAEKLPDGPIRNRETLTARLLLAEALNEAGRILAATTHFHIAVEQARAATDRDSFVRAALGFGTTQFLAALSLDQAVIILAEAEAALDPNDDRQRCLLLTQLARAHLLLGKLKSSERFDKQAMALARRLGDRNSLCSLLFNRHLVPRQIKSARDIDARITELDEIVQLSQDIDNDELKQRAYSLNLYVSAELGERTRMDRAVADVAELGDGRQRLLAQWIACHGEAMLAILNEDFVAAEVLAREGLDLGRQTHGAQSEGVYGIQMFSIRREQGRLAEVAPVIKSLIKENPDESPWLPGFALIAADLGYDEPARLRLREMAQTGFDMPLDAKRSTSLSYLAEVAALLGDTESAARLYDLMSVYRHMTITTGIATVCYGAASRYLGMLATTLGEFDKAAAHFEHALKMNSAMGARAWLAHTKAEYALLLRQRGGKDENERAEMLANEAWEIAAELDMVRLKRRLQPSVH